MPHDPLAAIAVGADALSTSKTVIPLHGDTSIDSHAKDVPHDALHRKLRLELTSIAGGATHVIWNLAQDAAGDFATTPEVTQEITLGATDVTNGGAVALVESQELPNDGQAHKVEAVYLVARVDPAGSADCKAILYWTE